MSIADKLVTIAENMQKVYDAGKAQLPPTTDVTVSGTLVSIFDAYVTTEGVTGV